MKIINEFKLLNCIHNQSAKEYYICIIQLDLIVTSLAKIMSKTYLKP